MSATGVSRRSFLRVVGRGVGVSLGVAVVNSLLAACGGQPATPTAPVGATTAPTATTASASGNATTRPAGSPTTGAAASPATSPAATTRSGDLIIGKAQEAVGLDPALVTAAASFDLLPDVYNPLIRFDEKYQPQPELAVKWSNPDDKTFVFQLRQGVKFHNGREMKAGDVKYSLERIMDPATKSPWSSQLEPIQSIETPDDSTVKILLKQPYGPLLATLSADWAAIVPKEEVAKNGDLQKTMVGTGPFVLKEYTRDTRTVMTANSSYWEAGLPRLAQLTYNILPDETARLSAVRTGQIGLTPLSDPASVGLAARSPGVKVITQPTTDYYLLGINCKKAPFDNPKVRQALSLAVDRKAVLDAVLFGEGQVTGPIVPTLGNWSTPVDQLPLYKPDQAKAKQLLAEAGVGTGLTMSILASPLYPQFISIALVLQRQLKAVGITVNLDQVEWGTFIDRWKKRDFETFVSYNGSGNDPDRALYPAFKTGGSVNAFQFSDPAIDKLLDEGRTTVDTAKRRTIYQQVDKLIAEAAPALFLFTRTAYFAHRENVRGFAPTPADTWGSLKTTTVS